MSRRTSLRGAPALGRVLTSAALGLAAGVGSSFSLPWQAAALIGWDVATAALLSWNWWAVGRLSAEEAQLHARREDPSRTLSEVIVLGACVAFLGAVALALVRAGSAHGGTKAYLLAVAVSSVALAWAQVHTVFTLRYARIYYAEPIGGIDFNEDEAPAYLDFAYLAFTIGMTFQVSDTNLTTKAIRRTALRHALLSYLFGAVILGLAINVVASIL